LLLAKGVKNLRPEGRIFSIGEAMGLAQRFSTTTHRRWGMRLAFAFIVAAALSYVPYRLVGGDGATRLSEMESELARTRADSQRLDVENQRKLRAIEALKNDPGAVEDYARSELGMAYPHEVLVRVTGEREEP
jgi:cell division protein FtsB